MEYVRRLIQETDYLKQMKQLEELERERRFCCHGLNHVLDVARIAWIHALEDGSLVDKEEIYLAALLHDLGRILEYQEEIPHHEAGRKLADTFLSRIGYPAEKRSRITAVIGEHREKDKLKDEFTELIKSADNSSRNCFYCEAEKECKWSTDRKNKTIIY